MNIHVNIGFMLINNIFYLGRLLSAVLPAYKKNQVSKTLLNNMDFNMETS